MIFLQKVCLNPVVLLLLVLPLSLVSLALTTHSLASHTLSKHTVSLHQAHTWNTSWGGLLPRACIKSDPATIVHWDTTVFPHRCKPDVCGNAVLTDIKDLDGKALVADICAGPLFDTQRTKDCLSGKNVLFLGDSTLQASCEIHSW